MSKKLEHLSDLNKKDRNKRHSSPFINVVKGVMTVGEITVGVMTVGVMTVGVMRRPLIFMATTLVSISYKEVMQKKTALSVNIKFICTSFRNRQNSERLASFSGLFRSEYK
jgi:hypothetical protein